ncbi:MAG TPA: hypothetical protein VED37_14245 [Ktedonobacteraceae bacterium]|nr:hypothetical protein [Ktedonobacteraceae bacterium]
MRKEASVHSTHRWRPSTVAASHWMLLILLLAALLHLILMQFNWPVANADESTIDLMARHIAYQGEHPIFFYGQNYMGSIQAYLGAVAIRFFGSSVFSVRLGTLLIFALYILCLYYLVRLLYTPAFALFIIALLSLGSDRMMGIPLTANGGYAETLLFGALIFLLVTWLGLTLPQQRARVAWQRLLVYAGLGCVIGLGLWSDQLILPAVFTGGLFLLLCCRREIWGWPIGALLVGFLVGAMPLIIYNVSAAPGQNSLYILLGTVFSGAARTIPFVQRIAQVLLISLPLATGIPFTSGIHTVCGTAEPYLHPVSNLAALFPTSNPWLCIPMHGGWSLAILMLWGIALAEVLLVIRQYRKGRQIVASPSDAAAAWRQHVRLYARLMLLGSGALWLLLFASSAAAEFTPRASCRYLICLLLAAPAVLWPLWQGIGNVIIRAKPGQRPVRSYFVLSAMALGVIVAVYLMGTGDIIANIPSAQSTSQRTSMLIQELLNHGATRVYSDYSTCNLLIFQSNERVICSVLDDHLQPGFNRYPRYRTMVEAAPHPAYIFPGTSAQVQALTSTSIAYDGEYQRLLLGGYIIYYYSPGI